MFDRLIALCRPGFEKECTAELQHLAGETGFAAYVRTKQDSGYVELVSTTRQPATTLFEAIDFTDLVFTRQWFASGKMLHELPETDRLSPLLAEIKRLGIHFADVEMSWPDTNEGKSISKFCRQFRPHLIDAVSKDGRLRHKASMRLHLFFLDSRTAFIGCARVDNSAAIAMGIPHLKMPAAAPSRSTLKLEEAMHWFINEEQERQFIKAGMKAVDLGAAPGGWTWQLARRGMLVTAVDNGPMQDELMQGGMVEHVRSDAFKWMPDSAVDWLVCDMVERPLHVSRMITRWFTQRRCHYSIFNLKLPMNKRFQSVVECLSYIHEHLDEAGIRHVLKAKHLYHDREEITVFLRCMQPDDETVVE